MNTNQKPEILDEMLNELNKVRVTKQAQIGYIADISEKSNNILLQIEASQRAKASKENPRSARYRYNKATLHSLAKTVETFKRLLDSNTVSPLNTQDFESYITLTKSKIDFLGSSVRKLLALSDTINQIGSELHNESDDFELDSTDTVEGNSSE